MLALALDLPIYEFVSNSNGVNSNQRSTTQAKTTQKVSNSNGVNSNYALDTSR